MNKKLKGLVVAGGVLAVLASLVPMASYAETAANTNVTVAVKPVLEIDLVSTSVSFGTVEPNKPQEKELAVTVTSNNPYTLAIRADQPNLVNEEASNNQIPALSGDLQSGTGWGIKKKIDKNTDATEYTAVTNAAEGEPFYTSTEGGADVETTFKVGLVVGPSTASGNYETSITVIASAAS